MPQPNKGQDFFFPAGFVMHPGQACQVYTNEVHPKPCGLSFNNGQAIWCNSSDTGYLYDAQGNVVSEWGYYRLRPIPMNTCWP